MTYDAEAEAHNLAAVSLRDGITATNLADWLIAVTGSDTLADRVADLREDPEHTMTAAPNIRIARNGNVRVNGTPAADQDTNVLLAARDAITPDHAAWTAVTAELTNRGYRLVLAQDDNLRAARAARRTFQDLTDEELDAVEWSYGYGPADRPAAAEWAAVAEHQHAELLTLAEQTANRLAAELDSLRDYFATNAAEYVEQAQQRRSQADLARRQGEHNTADMLHARSLIADAKAAAYVDALRVVDHAIARTV